MVWACFPTADTFEPLRSAWAKPAPSSLITPCPWNVASSKSPYDGCAQLRSSSWVAAPSVVWLHAIGQLLSPAGRCLSISTVHGGAGGGDGGGAGLDVVASASTLVARKSREMRSVAGFIVSARCLRTKGGAGASDSTACWSRSVASTAGAQTVEVCWVLRGRVKP